MNAFIFGNGEMRRIEGMVGETPPCPTAKYAPGDIVRIRRNMAVGHFPHELVVLVAVPPGFSPDHAIADLIGKPRPLMVRCGCRQISYILADPDGGTTPFHCRERDVLRAVGRVEIGSIRGE